MNNKACEPYEPFKDKNISKVLSGKTYTRADLMAKSRKREHPLKGFEDHYGSLVDYILRCTYHIWEEKNVGLIYTHYGEPNEIYTPLGYLESVQSVVESTTQHMYAFPDRQLYSLNVIWSGDEDKGYLSSHLNRSIMHNTGESQFGPATGNKVDAYAIADCLCKENKIIKEWLVRDNGAYLRQMGFDLEEIAYDMATKDVESDVKIWFSDELKERTSSSKKVPFVKEDITSNDEEMIAEMLHNVWHSQFFAMLDDYYSYNVQVWSLGGRNLCGVPNLKYFLSNLHSNFSNSNFQIDFIQSIESDAGSCEKLVHVRWSLCGRHATGGMFGKGTNAPLYLMGISHYRVVNGRIAEEWTVFDELSIWKQIKIAQMQQDKG